MHTDAYEAGSWEDLIARKRDELLGFSDIELACCYGDKLADVFRYVAPLGQWFVWDDAAEGFISDARQEIIWFVMGHCRDSAEKCPDIDRACKIASADTVRDIVWLLSADERIAATEDQVIIDWPRKS